MRERRRARDDKGSRKRRIARYRNETTNPLVIEDNSDESRKEGTSALSEEAEVDYYLHPTGERKLRGWWQNIRGREWMFHLFPWQRVLINFHEATSRFLFLFNLVLIVASFRPFEWLSTISILHPRNNIHACVLFTTCKWYYRVSTDDSFIRQQPQGGWRRIVLLVFKLMAINFFHYIIARRKETNAFECRSI